MDVDFGDMSASSGGGGAAGGSGSGGSGGDDITSDLLQKFSCMNTTDREVLVQQFKVLLGEKCSESNAEFWLDMNNWNLQAAVCSYFDYESQNSSYLIKLPSMSFISDASFVDRLPPNIPFTYQCIVTNSGDEPWPLGCSLRFCGGTQMSNEERVLLPSLNPGQAAEVKLSMISPDTAGGHQCQWRPATLTGQFFGETIFIIINVIDDLQSVTQQLLDAHLMDGMNPSGSSANLLSSNLPPIPLPSSATPIYDTPTLVFGGGASPNQFTAGMCIPGSTAASFTPSGSGPVTHQLASSLPNGLISSCTQTTVPQAGVDQQQQLQLLPSQPMLTHLNAHQVSHLNMLNPHFAASSHHLHTPNNTPNSDSVDDSPMS